MKSAGYNFDLSEESEGGRIYSGHGLNGMRERAVELDGTVEITQIAGNGVRVRASIPV